MENNYYKVGDKQLIDIMKDAYGEDAVFNFDILNAVKYLFRCKKKHETPINDLKKAITYIEHAITLADKVVKKKTNLDIYKEALSDYNELCDCVSGIKFDVDVIQEKLEGRRKICWVRKEVDNLIDIDFGHISCITIDNEEGFCSVADSCGFEIWNDDGNCCCPLEERMTYLDLKTLIHNCEHSESPDRKNKQKA